MQKKECKFSKDELHQLYIEENRTLREMCPILGIKSTITASKILQSYGISTNHNERIANKTKQNMSDDDFKNYITDLYINSELSLNEIGRRLNVCAKALRKYFKRYNIPLRETAFAKSIATQKERHPRWQGGKHVCNNGYIEVYCPEHPRAKSRKYVYEHILVMEKHIGRYLLPNEIVHHKNEIKTDNRIENLQLMTNNEHAALHDTIREKKHINVLNGAWSKKYECCINCGSTTVKHKGNGLCVNCYATMLRHKKEVMPYVEH
jgi:hypothetical protein